MHRHAHDYFWTAVTAGRGRQWTGDGTATEVDYEQGQTKRLTLGADEYLLHDLENIGTIPLIFTTVELLDKCGDHNPHRVFPGPAG
jgi:mannose-6-phosphate isomerase-like protein (cupin superfamily)